VLALLRDERVALELVADGVHLDREIVTWVEETAGLDRVLLVTDAMGAATCGDGAYRLGELDVEVADGVALVAGTDTIAGGTATMDRLFRARATHVTDAAAAPPALPRFDDESLAAAVRATATNPARAMGWGEIGAIAAGRRADLVVLDPTLVVREVIRAGRSSGQSSWHGLGSLSRNRHSQR
jgi:N-acetylglucosamine-6-phosphate deacetylase